VIRDRTNSDRTDKRESSRIDTHQQDRTDKHRQDRTDDRQSDRTDRRKEDRTTCISWIAPTSVSARSHRQSSAYRSLHPVADSLSPHGV